MIRYFMLIFLWPSLAIAQTDTTVEEPRDQVIVIEPDDVRERQPVVQVFVESGDDVIVGSPEENVKAAYRKWKEACESWKKELKSNNRKNLMIASCGAPQRRSEKVELSTLYTFESKATYKIKVNCN